MPWVSVNNRLVRAEVEWHRLSVEYGGQDPRVAGDPACFTGAEAFSGVDAAGDERLVEVSLLDRDHHGAGDFGVQSVGGQVLEQLHEGETRTVRHCVSVEPDRSALRLRCPERGAPG